MRQSGRVVRVLTQPALRRGVGEDVGALGNPDVGRHRYHRQPGQQATGDGQDGRRRRGGQHRYPLRAPDTVGHRGGGTDQVAATKDYISETHRICDILTASADIGVERGQQHVR